MSAKGTSRYEELGVRPLINCVGTVTRFSGSLALPEVRQAMTQASMQYVMIEELMDAVGARLAEVMQCEWGLVTNGCAAALAQVTAACVAGTDSGSASSVRRDASAWRQDSVETALSASTDASTDSVSFVTACSLPRSRS